MRVCVCCVQNKTKHNLKNPINMADSRRVVSGLVNYSHRKHFHTISSYVLSAPSLSSPPSLSPVSTQQHTNTLAHTHLLRKRAYARTLSYILKQNGACTHTIATLNRDRGASSGDCFAELSDLVFLPERLLVCLRFFFPLDNCHFSYRQNREASLRLTVCNPLLTRLFAFPVDNHGLIDSTGECFAH